LAQYPGGNEELICYLKENVRLSKSQMKGVVDVGMVIDKDGSILYPEVVSSTVRKLDEEALRLVKAMPKWKPASIGKDEVKLRVGVRICFKNLDNSWFFIDDEDLWFSSY
jgi:protein TonB